MTHKHSTCTGPVVRNDDFSFPEGRNHALCGYACPDGISQGYLGFIGITRIQRLDSHSPSPFLIPNDTLYHLTAICLLRAGVCRIVICELVEGVETSPPVQSARRSPMTREPNLHVTLGMHVCVSRMSESTVRREDTEHRR